MLNNRARFLAACPQCYRSGRFTFASKPSKPKNPKKYSHTISLPKTLFPHRLNPDKRVAIDADIIKNCGFSELYAAQRLKPTEEEFTLHDGPPYANGVPHMGHAINKILKDITNRWNLLQGKKIHFTPGWDCHGLPIELKVLSSEKSMQLTPLEIRSKAREFAKRTISEQKCVFRSWGIMAEWDAPGGCYHTFDPSYVSNQMKQFFQLYEDGFVYRSLKPVYWSPSAKTALAESELEYNPNHQSTAVTVKLKILNPPVHWGEGDSFALVWTTTPWTLPCNQAIAYNPELGYAVVKDDCGIKYIMVSSLVDQVSVAMGRKFEVLVHFKGGELEGLKYFHPLSRSTHSFFPGTHVTADVGTGLVHTAPSHGHDDFIIGISNNLPLECIVDENGVYNKEAGEVLEGLKVLTEGNKKVLDIINQDIVHREEYVHSYPYDWRTKTPVIIRSSLQWFIDTDAIKSSAIDALRNVDIVPAKNVEGMVAQMERRPYWCISRQRSWGVPIPVLYDGEQQPLINSDLIKHYQRLNEEHGTDFWWTTPVQDLVPEYMQRSFQAEHLIKGEDILDIWLDSGISWSSVLGGRVADLYLEGVDQFTGWFQSSLITSVALQGRAPYRKVLVHGFAVDGSGKKMSKSLGNVIDPQDIARGGPNLKANPPYGVDVLRWWVASHGLQHTTIAVSKALLDESAESVKRMRNILKFLVGAICDFSESLVFDPPPLSPMDKYFLVQLQDFENRVNDFYSTYQYNKVCALITNFVANELSSFYCHITKDRLYCEGLRSDRRKAVQYVMYQSLNTLTKTFAPIMPVLAEELFTFHPHQQDDPKPFFFKFDKFQPIHLELEDDERHKLKSSFRLVKSIKEVLLSEIPVNLKSTEMVLTLNVNPESYAQLKILQSEDESCHSDLTDFFQVSSVILKSDEKATPYSINLVATDYELCERCRKYCVHGSSDVCDRCDAVLDVIPTVEVSSI